MTSSNEYMREYMKRRYHERRNAAIDILGGKCKRCGTIENLQFDHTDRKKKSADIAKIWSYAEARWLEEVNKCQLLCRTCHVDKTFESGDIPNKKRAAHGSLVMYQRYKCRCDACREINNRYSREWKRKNKRL